MTDEIRYLGDMQRLRPEPGEVFVLNTDALLCAEQHSRIQEMWRRVMPDNKLIVLDRGVKLGVIAPVPEIKP